MKSVSILVVWEDRLHEALDTAIREAHRRLRQAEQHQAVHPRLFFDSLCGYGRFKGHLEKDFPIMRRHGLLRSGPMDHVIYVLDADKTNELLETLGLQPPSAGTTWFETAEDLIAQYLRDNASEPDRAHVILLRWAQETLFLAAHDEPSWDRLQTADIQSARSDLYQDCSPSPTAVADAAFVESFSNWKKCIKKTATHLDVKPFKKATFAWMTSSRRSPRAMQTN